MPKISLFWINCLPRINRDLMSFNTTEISRLRGVYVLVNMLGLGKYNRKT